MPVARDLPIIDFAPFCQGEPAGQQQVAQAIYQACHQVGFFYVVNHGIAAEAIAQAFQQSQAFFALPTAAKQQSAWANEFSNQGYIGVERERLDETQPGDLKEALNLSRDVAAPPPPTATQSALLDDWPAGLPAFRTTLSRFFQDCTATANHLFRAFAIALNLPEDAIARQHQNQEFTLRLLHYPPLTTPPQPGQLRAGAHSDYGSLTLLFQDQVGGLEVQTAAGEWLSAPAIDAAILVNTGDLTQRWSNDIFRSTQHRVVIPEGDAALRDRYSIAFFCQPDATAEIRCLPSCQSPDNPPRYAPITSGDYLLSRLRATY
ncbi:isopenicillin N synthase family dioxygenase [Almyronema epifaneia]|uniref:Isopenicillin N synthase family dioxygenase n=1 Tax=Almyronema epifaneia S1 TaxID=2991925 RepID=A0ABW6IIH5_9CYAN